MNLPPELLRHTSIFTIKFCKVHFVNESLSKAVADPSNPCQAGFKVGRFRGPFCDLKRPRSKTIEANPEQVVLGVFSARSNVSVAQRVIDIVEVVANAIALKLLRFSSLLKYPGREPCPYIFSPRFRTALGSVWKPWGTAPASQRASPHSRSDRKSTRLNASHLGISYALFVLK